MLFGRKTRYTVQTLGSEVLRATAAPIPAVTDEIRELADFMIQAVRVFDGIGLAAPQVGRSLRMVVLDVPQSSEPVEKLSPGELELLPRMPLVLINPEIIASGTELTVRDEGCLSVPEIFAPVVRPAQVTLRATGLDGGPIVIECGGLLGRCVQHELDHLEGTLFPDRVSPEERKYIEADLRKLERYGEKHHFQRVIVR